MKAWLTYFKERYPPYIVFPLIVGLTLSGLWIGEGGFNPLSLIISCLVIFYATFYLRLKNDFDDFERDRIAFPNRPLPRGLISRYDVREIIRFLEISLAVLFGIIFVLYAAETRLALLLTGAYLWLMAHEFYAKNFMKRNLLVKEIFLQGFFIPVTLLVIGIWDHQFVFSLRGLSYSLVVFGAFFTYDLCRKLDPFSHPASLTFVHYYGFNFTYYVVIGALLVSAIGAYGLGLQLWLWPCELGIWFFLHRVFKYPKKFFYASIAALLSLFVHVSSVFLI